jgi:hypothetical protein
MINKDNNIEKPIGGGSRSPTLLSGRNTKCTAGRRKNTIVE